MFLKSHAYEKKRCLCVPAELGGKGAASCREPPAPGQWDEGKGTWQAIEGLWAKASGVIEPTALVPWVLHPGISLGKWGISQRGQKYSRGRGWRSLNLVSPLQDEALTYQPVFPTFLFNYTEASGDCSTSIQEKLTFWLFL